MKNNASNDWSEHSHLPSARADQMLNVCRGSVSLSLSLSLSRCITFPPHSTPLCLCLDLTEAHTLILFFLCAFWLQTKPEFFLFPLQHLVAKVNRQLDLGYSSLRHLFYKDTWFMTTAPGLREDLRTENTWYMKQLGI